MSTGGEQDRSPGRADSDERRRVAQVQTVMVAYSGPIPSPEILARYDEIDPGIAREIVAMARQQSTNRHALERSLVAGRFRNELAGILCGAAVALASVWGSVELTRAGFPGGGLAAILIEIAAIAGVFFVGARRSAQGFPGRSSGPASLG